MSNSSAINNSTDLPPSPVGGVSKPYDLSENLTLVLSIGIIIVVLVVVCCSSLCYYKRARRLGNRKKKERRAKEEHKMAERAAEFAERAMRLETESVAVPVMGNDADELSSQVAGSVVTEGTVLGPDVSGSANGQDGCASPRPLVRLATFRQQAMEEVAPPPPPPAPSSMSQSNLALVNDSFRNSVSSPNFGSRSAVVVVGSDGRQDSSIPSVTSPALSASVAMGSPSGTRLLHLDLPVATLEGDDASEDSDEDALPGSPAFSNRKKSNITDRLNNTYSSPRGNATTMLQRARSGVNGSLSAVPSTAAAKHLNPSPSLGPRQMRVAISKGTDDDDDGGNSSDDVAMFGSPTRRPIRGGAIGHNNAMSSFRLDGENLSRMNSSVGGVAPRHSVVSSGGAGSPKNLLGAGSPKGSVLSIGAGSPMNRALGADGGAGSPRGGRGRKSKMPKREMPDLDMSKVGTLRQ
eukprot:PhM_4_TR5997/c0_g1_i1/m.78905